MQADMPIVGWYVYRANTTPVPSLRESAVHAHLVNAQRNSLARLKAGGGGRPAAGEHTDSALRAYAFSPQPLVFLVLSGCGLENTPRY